MLVRSRVLLAMLVLYPLIVALIVGGVLLDQGPPRIAFVNEDHDAGSVRVGDTKLSIDEYVQRAEREGVDVVEMSRTEADHALDQGQVAGVLVVPRGTTHRLESGLSSTAIEFHVGDSPLGTIVAQRMKGAVYSINLAISRALIEANEQYLDTLVDGGDVEFDDTTFELYGLAPVEEDLRAARDELEHTGADDELLERLDRAIAFAGDARTAMRYAGSALEATAAPVRVDVQRARGRSPLLTAQALGFALAVSIAFACVVLIASSLAAERDDAVLGRVLRGLARPWHVVAGKLLLGAVLAAVFCTGLFAVFAILEPQAWVRLPLLLAAVVLASLACSSIGALIAVLTRDARTATLVAILLVLPLAPLALVGTHGVIHAVEYALPVAPSRELFNAVLFDADPWRIVLEQGTRLLLIAAVPFAIATRLLHRLA